MCTIEMIENLKIENSTKMWVCAISPYERRYMDSDFPFKKMEFYYNWAEFFFFFWHRLCTHEEKEEEKKKSVLHDF